MRRLETPKFLYGGGMILDPQFLPTATRDELRKLLPKAVRMDDRRAGEFLDRCAEHAHMAIEEGFPESAAGIQSALKSVAVRARSLQQALGLLTDDAKSAFQAHWDYLAFGSKPPVSLGDLSKETRALEGRFLGAVWELVSDLEAASTYAADQCKPARQAKSSEIMSRRLVHFTAIQYANHFGAAPPYSKGTWFPEFMATIGRCESVNLKIGRALVEAVVKANFRKGPG